MNSLLQNKYYITLQNNPIPRYHMSILVAFPTSCCYLCLDIISRNSSRFKACHLFLAITFFLVLSGGAGVGTGVCVCLCTCTYIWYLFNLELTFINFDIFKRAYKVISFTMSFFTHNLFCSPFLPFILYPLWL